MQVVETIFYFIVTIGVLVTVHEFGHFIAAKLCGMRADKFFIGFDFWGLKLWSVRHGETEYGIGAFPLGGYVKIAGMIDESFDTEQLERPPEPWEFRSKPIWQRMIVISAGVVMNILLAVLVFWGINYVQGKNVRETTEIGYVVEKSPAALHGLKSGDKVLSINDKIVDHWDLISQYLYIDDMGKDLTMSVLRDGKEVQLFFPRSSIPDPDATSFGIVPRHTEIIIQSVDPGKPADQLGLKPRDVILSLNGISVQYNDKKVNELVRGSAGKPLLVEWKRGEQRMTGVATPTSDGKIGIAFVLGYTGPVRKTHYSLFGAFPEGVKDIVVYTKLSALQISQIITGKRAFSQSVGGPIKIAQIASQTAELGIMTFLGFMALLSISLAVLNILPFPALDGGHLLFLLYEGVFRREIPVKVKLGLQKAGMALLLAFMLFVVYNDIRNF